MSRALLFQTSVAVLTAALGQAKAQTQPKPLVFSHVTVVDVAGASVKPDRTVVVIGNRVADVGDTRSISIPTESQVVDAAGRYLIPGLWDMHVHLGDATEMALPVLVASGVTGVRDMGSPSLDTLRRWHVEALAGKRPGPRIVAAGPILDGGPFDENRRAVRSEAEARRAVDDLAGAGVGFIKVHEHLSREVYFAIADEARKQDIPFAGHVPVGDNGFVVSGIEASNAGQKCFEHMFGIPFQVRRDQSRAELFATLRRNGTWVDPTLTVFWTRAHIREVAAKQDPRTKYVAPALKQLWEERARGFSKDDSFPAKLLEWRTSDVKDLYDAGVPLLAGTDLGFPYVFPGDLSNELERLVEAGLPAAEALRAATINAARYLGRENTLGTVEKGKLADLVLLDANPLEDIRNVRKISTVVLNGHLLNRKALDDLLAQVEGEVHGK
jgi:imidazolonepropionase-like amidohydrolase